VFGPQKGADADDVRVLEAALASFARLLDGGEAAGAPGAGAAGGTGYGFLAAWGATIESGARAIAELTGATDAVSAADVVLTGEGRFDATSGTGKVVGSLLGQVPAGTRTGVIAGQLAADPPDRGWAIAGLAGSVEAAIADPSRWLREAGAMAAAELGG
jgi:glycerate 2-kinase